MVEINKIKYSCCFFCLNWVSPIATALTENGWPGMWLLFANDFASVLYKQTVKGKEALQKVTQAGETALGLKAPACNK